ncbi:uncharacterized protein LOC111713632 [Eurytemora carolleeae]|uniref:uncharacterized protein LOC111713632 n=1 Tax=Eurytemora carolleeae TaxID=1294199 RepID=UPI000C75C054|nr:uncharacterized protein LOC111713632 [Eurytemora carolleeae]|eukprot:XP_023344310.1 uncharacterized protein LOC111713632 [Eurytemora affinis]
MGDFDAGLDLKDVERWVEELEKNGFVCLQGVLNIHEIQHTRNLFWDWLESLGSGISREDSTTWKDENWPGDLKTGIITSHGGAHSQAMWYIRSLDQVKEIFSSIWGSHELMTSFEAPVIWRPWSSPGSSGWKPETEGLHLNQNPTKKSEYRTIQGSIPLYDVTEETGGLEFVLESHKKEMAEQISKAYPFFKHLDHFCQVRYNDFKEEVKLVKCSAGDLILWDSRCILGDRVGSSDLQSISSLLIRCPVTMQPRVGVPNPVIKLRTTALRDGLSLTSLFNEFRVFSLHNTGGSKIIKLFIQPTFSDTQKKLI